MTTPNNPNQPKNDVWVLRPIKAAPNHNTCIVLPNHVRPLYVVRYVYTARLEDGATLPERPPFRDLINTDRAQTNDYIARLLRPGWLYVREENGQEQFHVFKYEQKEQNGEIQERFIKYEFANRENAKGGLIRDTSESDDGSRPYPFINRDATDISIRYSEHEWSAETIDDVHQNDKVRSESMQYITLNGQDRHTVETTAENLTDMIEEYRPEENRIKPVAEPKFASPDNFLLDVTTKAEQLCVANRAMTVCIEDPEGREEPPIDYYAIHPTRLAAQFDFELDEDAVHDQETVNAILDAHGDTEAPFTWAVDALEEGYLYVFVDGYLYQEHKITLNKDKKPLFQQIDLSQAQGEDERPYIKGLKLGFVTAPVEAQSVEIGYSKFQWSWLRINTLGGIAPSSAFPNAAVAGGDTVLAANDARLSDDRAATRRQQRLQPVQQAANEIQEWCDLDKPVFKTDACYEVLSETTREHIAETSKYTLDESVIGVTSMVLHDHLDVLQTLINRHGTTAKWMSELLDALNDPYANHSKNDAYPFARYFDSALMLNNELIAKNNKDPEQYYADTQRYRDMIHRNNLLEALGGTYRKQVNRLMTLTHNQLSGFVLGNSSSADYPSLTSDLQTLWFNELQDLLALPFDTGTSLYSSKAPKGDLFYEFLGDVMKATSCLPNSLDITIDADVETHDNYKKHFIDHEAIAWLREIFSEESEIWEALINARIDGVEPEIESDDDNGSSLSGTSFQIQRRLAQAVLGMMSSLLPAYAAPYTNAGLTPMKAMVQRLLGFKLKEAPIADSVDLQLFDRLQDRLKTDIPEAERTMLASHYIKEPKPFLVVAPLGGDDKDTIFNKRKAEWKTKKANRDAEREELAEQWEYDKEEQQREATRQHDGQMSRIEADQQRVDSNVTNQQKKLEDARRDFEEADARSEKKLKELKPELSHAEAEKRQWDATYDQAKKTRDHHYQQAQNAYHDVNFNKSTQRELTQRIENAERQLTHDAQNTFDYYKDNLTEAGAQVQVDDLITQRQSEIDKIRQQLSETQNALSGLEEKMAQEKATARSKAQAFKDMRQSHQDATNAFDELNAKYTKAEKAKDNAKHRYEADKQRGESDLEKLKQKKQAFDEKRPDLEKDAENEFKQATKKAKENEEQLARDFDKETRNQSREFSKDTRLQLDRRAAKKRKHDGESDRKIEAAKEAGVKKEQIFDLREKEDLARWEAYQRTPLKQRFVVVPGDQMRQHLFEQMSLQERVRPKDKTLLQLMDPELVDELSPYERAVLEARFIDQETYDRYKAEMTKRPVLSVDVEAALQQEKHLAVLEAQAGYGDRMTVSQSLSTALGIIEVMNLMGAAETIKADASGYNFLSLFSCVFDVAASVEALAKYQKLAAFEAKLPPRKVAVFKTAYRLAPVAFIANALTAALFIFDMVQAIRRDDDAAYSYAVLSAGAIWAFMAPLSAGGLAGVALMLLGAFLLHFVFRESTDSLETVLSYGPFGVEWTLFNTPKKGGITVKHDFERQRLIIKSPWRRFEIDAKDFRLLKAEKAHPPIATGVQPMGVSMMPYPEDYTAYEGYTEYFEHGPESPEGYYLTNVGEPLLLGHLGEPIAGGKLENQSDLEHFLVSPFQELSDDRFKSDSYKDPDLGFGIDPTEWRGMRPAEAYHEAVISALYPLQLELEVGAKRVQEYGHMSKRKWGNELRIRYKIPFMEKVPGKISLTLEISNGKQSKKINIVKLISGKKDYLKVHQLPEINSKKDSEKMVEENIALTEIEIDLDHKIFVGEQGLGGILVRGDRVVYEAALHCEYNINGNSCYQPPLTKLENTKRRDNEAKRKESAHFNFPLKNNEERSL